MNRLIRSTVAATCAVGSMLIVGAGVAGADTTTTTAPTTTTTAVPYASGNQYMSFNVETVVGGGSPAGSVFPGSCTLENDFGLGATVVFRMWGTDFENAAPLVGGAGANPNVSSVTINGLPGATTAPTMSYSTSDGYWTYGWKTSTATPTGTVAYTVTVTLNPVGAVYKPAFKNVVKTVNGKKVVRKVSYKRLVSASIPAESYTFVPPKTQDVVLSASV
ncbi:MAG: hypothetical protein WCA31_01695 [Acidimicrobiales bacterium]